VADLLIDLGNSRLKWALVENEPVAGKPLAWRGRLLEELLDAAWGKIAPPRRVAAASVAPAETRRALENWVESRWQRPIRFIGAAAGWPGLQCGYEAPAQLGADRWAALVAAHERYGEGSLVVDCGTAVTLDAIARGRHLGGYILPGLEEMRRSVLANTALEPLSGGEVSTWEWGRDTASCLGRGTAGAIVALVEASLERLQAAGGCDPVLVLTGGAAGSIEPLIQVDYRRHPDLVLEGVRLCAWRTPE